MNQRFLHFCQTSHSIYPIPLMQDQQLRYRQWPSCPEVNLEICKSSGMKGVYRILLTHQSKPQSVQALALALALALVLAPVQVQVPALVRVLVLARAQEAQGSG